MADTLPLGLLISFGSVVFMSDQSVLDQWPVSTAHEEGTTPGSPDSFDWYGDGPAPNDNNIWIWQYDIMPAFGTSITDSPPAIGAELNRLYRAWRGVDGFGISGQVGTLVVEDWETGGPVSARARLFNIEKVAHGYSILSLRLHFSIPTAFR